MKEKEREIKTLQCTREKQGERKRDKISHRKLSKLTLYFILHARTHKDIIKFYGSIQYIIFSKSFFYLLNYYQFIQYFLVI